MVTTVVGIDVGLTTLATLSDGTEIENPRWTRAHEDRIAAANRLLARKKWHSNHRAKAREALHRAHPRAANARKNYLHHVSKWLVGGYDLIAYEALKVQGLAQGGLTKSIIGQINRWPNQSLAKSITDAAWAILRFQLRYKAESAGAYAIAVNPRGTSQICSACGEKVPKELSQRRHDCPHCGLSVSRDHHAGRNILALGMSAAGSPALPNV
jgi:putative transposase